MVQYSGDNAGAYATSYGIPFMCEFMLNTNNTEIENIAEFNAAMVAFYNDANFTATENSYTAFVEYLKSGGENNADAATRYWTWQTCTEFGYFQSTDMGQSIFGSPTPVKLVPGATVILICSAFSLNCVSMYSDWSTQEWLFLIVWTRRICYTEVEITTR